MVRGSLSPVFILCRLDVELTQIPPDGMVLGMFRTRRQAFSVRQRTTTTFCKV